MRQVADGWAAARGHIHAEPAGRGGHDADDCAAILRARGIHGRLRHPVRVHARGARPAPYVLRCPAIFQIYACMYTQQSMASQPSCACTASCGGSVCSRTCSSTRSSCLLAASQRSAFPFTKQLSRCTAVGTGRTPGVERLVAPASGPCADALGRSQAPPAPPQAYPTLPWARRAGVPNHSAHVRAGLQQCHVARGRADRALPGRGHGLALRRRRARRRGHHRWLLPGGRTES